MSLVNYRTIRDRFTHIDAVFDSCAVSVPGESHYAVRLYPWWEHPRYLAAIEKGSGWAGRWPPEASKKVTVYPRGLIDARIQPVTDVIDWSFIDEPSQRLWPYEIESQVICRSSLSVEALLQLAAEIARRADYPVDSAAVVARLDPITWPVPSHVERPGGFSLGRFPLSLLDAVYAAMAGVGISWLERKPLTPTSLPVMFLIDGDDYIVAEDFEVEVPEFEHEEAWIQWR